MHFYSNFFAENLLSSVWISLFIRKSTSPHAKSAGKLKIYHLVTINPFTYETTRKNINNFPGRRSTLFGNFFHFSADFGKKWDFTWH